MLALRESIGWLTQKGDTKVPERALNQICVGVSTKGEDEVTDIRNKVPIEASSMLVLRGFQTKGSLTII